MSISRTIAKNTLFNFISTATDVAISFVVSILLARGLGTEEYGRYSFLMWFLSLAALLVNLGLGEMTRRYVAEAVGRGDKEAPTGIIQLVLVIRVGVTLLVSLIIIVISGYLTQVFHEVNSGTYFILIAVALLPNTVDLVLSSIFTGFQKYEYGAYIGLLMSPLRLVGIIVMLALGYGVKEIIMMTTVVWFIGMIVGFLVLGRLMPLRALVSKSRLEPALRKSALKYSSALMGIQGVNYFLWSQAEVLFLGLYTTVESIAFYNLAFKIPQMTINLIPFVFGRVLLPTIAEQFGKGEISKVRAIYITSARYLMMLTFPLVAGGIALASPIIHTFYGAQYEQSIVLMQIVFIPFSLMGLIHASTSVIYGINKPSFILKTGIVVIIVSIGLYLWMIPRYGVMGAAIASSVPRIIVFPIYNYYVSKKIGVHWPVGDSVRVILAAVIMGAVVFGIQEFLGDITSLIIGIPVGVIIFFIALIVLRFNTSQEIGLLRKIEPRLPSAIRSKYTSIVGLVETFARKGSAIQ
jgi:O-antigen/teichoic acid export membrane protein